MVCGSRNRQNEAEGAYNPSFETGELRWTLSIRKVQGPA